MNLVVGYCFMAGISVLASVFVFRKLDWPASTPRRFAAAAAAGALWPLALPLLSFGSAGIAVADTRTSEPAEVVARVAPAA